VPMLLSNVIGTINYFMMMKMRIMRGLRLSTEQSEVNTCHPFKLRSIRLTYLHCFHMCDILTLKTFIVNVL